MTQRLIALTVASFVSLTALAQGLRLPVEGVGSPAAASQIRMPSAVPQAADYIVTVVNSEPITNSEVQAMLERAQQQLAQQHRPQAMSKEMARQVLERLINEKIQLQKARESSIRIDDVAIDQAEQNIARQNQMDVTQLRHRIALEGVSLNQFRDQLRDQIMLTRLRERDVEPTVRVSDLDVDQYLRDQSNNNNMAAQEINLAQILIAVPDAATPEQVASLQAKAQRALERARTGEDFVALVHEFSDASSSASDGQLGLRTADHYPPLFVEATHKLGVGELSGLVRSGAGFHILKVLEKKSAGLPDRSEEHTSEL